MSAKRRKTLLSALVTLFLTASAVIALFPVFYAFMASGKSNQDILANPRTIIPEKFVFDNYIQAWNAARFDIYTFNSVYMSFFIVVGVVFTVTIAGYVFDRGKFRGKEVLFYMMLSSMFVSLGSLTLYPQLMIARGLGLNRTLWGVILIRVLGLDVTNLFIARSFISTISREIDEAAKIDGCSFFGIYRRIIFPLCKPLIATVGILQFRSAWNDYLMPMVFTMSNPERMPLVVGVVNLKSTGEAASSWNLMLAGTSISMLPMIVVFIFLNRYFISGLTSGAVKG